MSGGQDGSPLPPPIEEAIAEVLATAALEFAEGRDEVERELRAHFEDGLAKGLTATDLLKRFGNPLEAGRRIAKARSGRRTEVEQSTGRWWMSLREWWAELRRAARRLRRAPAFSAIVILTLGLGVGANTAVFTVLDSVLLESLPYGEPDRLVRVYESHERWGGEPLFLRAPAVRAFRTWDAVFESFGALYTYRETGADLTDGDVPRRVTVVRASYGYFETLGIAPQRGRTFTEDESFGVGESGGSRDLIAQVAVMSDGLWRDHFGTDPDIVGRTIALDGASFEVVGVMPAGFEDPFGARGDVWVPQDLRMGGSNSYGNYYLSAIARLADGVSIGGARERARALAANLDEQVPDMESSIPVIEPLQDDVVGSTRALMLWILAAAAGLVLLTACVNVANLLIARGLGQDRQLALRSALGSGRGRLVAGILTENGLLAVLGGLAGLGIGWAMLRGLLMMAPDALPRIADVEMGTSVFLFAFAVTSVALAAFGLLPALRLSRTAPAEVLRAGDRSASAGRVARRIRDLLVVAQVAAALMLVAGAGLLTRSFAALSDLALGVDPTGVLTYEVHLPSARYPDGPARHLFHEQLHDRLRALSSVESVGATSWLPVNGRYHSWGFQWDPDGGRSEDADFNATDVRIIAGDYFETLGIEVLRGVSPADVDYEAESVAWVNERLVRDYFGDADPIGQEIFLNGWRRIAGLVRDVPYGARGEHAPKTYLPHAQYNDDRNWALIQTVKARGDLGELRAAIADEIAALDGQLVLYRPQSFEDVLAEVRSQDRFATVLMGAFAVLALLLSVLGTYGVLAGSVAGRTREFGIRMALGADGARVRSMVLRYAAGITLTGVVLGLVGAWVGSRWIEALLFDVGSTDPLTYVATTALFLGVSLFAAWLPARRATRVDTVQALAAE